MNGRDRLAWNLRLFRSKKGLTQEALAAEADVDRTYISGIENGSFNASVDVIDRLSAALNVDVGVFLQLPPPDATPPKNQQAGRKKV